MDIKKFVRVGVGVLILNEKEQVLLGLRHSDPEKADSELHGEGTWTCPGGKMDFQETVFECGKREVKEETSVEVNNLQLFSISNDRAKESHFITIGLMAKEFKGEPKIMEPDEIVEWRWFDLNNLPKKIFFPSEKMIKNFIAKKMYVDS